MKPDEFQSPEKDFVDTARPTKRRKFYRKRVEDEDHEPSASAAQEVQNYATSLTLDELVISQNIIPIVSTPGNDSNPSVADIIRQRKTAQRKRGGIEFSNATPISATASATPRPSSALINSKDDALADIEAVVNRFTPQTGQVVDVDNKHMMAYIDAELAKRRQGQDNLDPFASGYGGHGLGGLGATDLGVQRQPAALGKLHEIDLGPDATLRNIARTEAAKRRLEDGEEDVEERSGKMRLRKDGKPWRGRRRRNSEDVKRDKLVEEVLRESRLEIYDELEADAPNDDQAADDRIAEQFRREFLDAISSRRQRTGPATTTSQAKGAKVDDKPKGPKLGGSRMARAAMREQQEKAEKAAKK